MEAAPLIDSGENSANETGWLPLFISLMLVLLTFLVFLVTYSEPDPEKAESFRGEFRRRLIVNREGPGGPLPAASQAVADPLQLVVTRLKSEGLSVRLIDEFLTLSLVRDLMVSEIKSGVAVTLPEVLLFAGNGRELTRNSRRLMERFAFLAAELPYLVEIKTFMRVTAAGNELAGLEEGGRRSLGLYREMLARGVAPEKLKASAFLLVPADSGAARVEIEFKEPEL